MTQSRSWWTRPLAVLASSTSAVFCSLVLLGLFPGVSQAQTDTTPPTATLSAPTANARLADLSGGISGTATDSGSGVASVSVRLSRNWPNTPTLYWNGSSWQSTAISLPTQLGTANGSGTKTWTVTSALPTGSNFAPGRYGIYYQAKDGANLSSTAQTPLIYSGTDTLGPQITVTSPAATGAYLPTEIPTTLSGTVKDPLNTDGSDGSGVSYLFIRFMRAYNGSNEFWNSATSTWSTSTTVQTAATLGAPDANGVCTWSVTATLPPSVPQGTYSYWVESDDRCGNFSYTQPVVKVLPLDTIAPQASLTSPVSNSNQSSFPTTWTGKVWDPDDENGASSGVARFQLHLWRTWAGTNEYWNGSAWSSTDFLFTPTLGTPDANEQMEWNLSPTLPSGSNLLAGNYLISLLPRDRYGNASVVQFPFSIGSPDSTAPTVSIATPTDGSLLDTSTQSLGPVSGSASDGASGSGVSRVRVQVMRNWTGTPEYWNGSVWGASAGNGAYATLATPDANGTLNWSLASGSSALPPAAQLPSGTYTLNAIAYDRFDNTTSSSVTIQVLPQDSSAPTVSITTPSEGAAVTSLPSITGTASDSGSGLTRVDVLLSRITTNGGLSYWTGTSWSSVQTYLSGRTEVGWTRSTNLPSGSNLIAGAYIISATAYDRYGNASTTATRTFGVVQSLDGLIAAGDDTTAAPLTESAYAGKYIINSTGTNQDASASGGAGSPIDFSVKVHKYGGSDDVTFTAPALDNGWSAAYYDANGVDITSAVTGTGWVHAMLTGEEAIITVEVTPPTSLSTSTTRELLVQASTTGQKDVVKAVMQGLPVVQPDIDVQRLTFLDPTADDNPADWVGTNDFSNTQAISALTIPGQLEKYAVRVKNLGATAEAFTLKLSTPVSGWTLTLLDANNQTVNAVNPTTWTLPSLAGGESTTLTLQAQSTLGTTAGNDTTITVNSTTAKDTFVVHNQIQSVAGVEYSVDYGATWQAVPAQGLEVTQGSTVGLRCLPSNSTAGWPDEPFKPEWTYGLSSHVGSEIWIDLPELTSPDAAGEEIQVECGNTISLHIKVTPDTEN